MRHLASLAVLTLIMMGVWRNLESTELQKQVGKVEAAAKTAIMAMQRKDLEQLSRVVHPSKGVRVSPYELVDPNHIILSADQVRTGWSSQHMRIWGTYDGTGSPIKLIFRSYFTAFIYDRDYAAAPVVRRGRPQGHSNTPNNIAEFYPEAVVFEYFFPESPQMNNWNCLWLVFEQEGDDWFLVGIVHGEWTI